MPLSTVSKLIAVSSCKGGVGKSTVALELAYHLRRRGHRVGLFDADVHGPSLPTQIPLGDVRLTLAADGRSVQPLEHGGVQLMSFGWFSRLWSRRPAAEIRVRGPLATNLLQTTQWGDLDYLLIDSPPGTGDIPSQIARLPLHGAVAVTTPSRLSVVDVVRGILFLRRLGVPVLALVENMASFRCDGCGKDHYPFGRGHAAGVLADVAAAEATDPPPAIPTFALPIVPDLGGASGDSSAAPRLDGASAPLESSLDALADALDRATCGDPPALLPHQLAFHEVPHWPTEMAMAEYVEQRVSGSVQSTQNEHLRGT